MEMKVYDPNGKWFVSKALFGFTDPTNGNRFEPGVHTKAQVTEWTAVQGDWLSDSSDPQEAAAEQAKVEAAAQAAEVAAVEAAKKEADAKAAEAAKKSK